MLRLEYDGEMKFQYKTLKKRTFSQVKITIQIIKGSKNIIKGYIGVRLVIFSILPAVYKPGRFDVI